MQVKKRIALVAHDERKKDLIEWVRENHGRLARHDLYGTGTTGHLVHEQCGLPVTCLKSGPLGGDQQLGAMIANNELDLLIFFWDPMQAQPHDVDVKALLRMSVLYNIPSACNRSTADFMISSRWFDEPYEPVVKNYQAIVKPR